MAPLSFSQQRLWFIEQFEQGTDAYHIPCLFRLTSAVNQKVLMQALNLLIKRHSVLRTVIQVDSNGDYYQKVTNQQITLNQYNQNTLEDMKAQVLQLSKQPFELTNEIPIKAKLYMVGENCYLFLLFHHIAFDGWSLDIFTQELSELYQQLLSGSPVTPQGESINYLDYSAWQRAQFATASSSVQLEYWSKKLDGYQLTELVTDYARPTTFDYQGRDVTFEIPPALSEKLSLQAREQSTSLYTLLLSAWMVTLSRAIGQNDMTVGSPSDNREHPQLQNLIGFFVNTLALRCQLQEQQSIAELIQQMHNTVTESKIYQSLPFEKLVDHFQVERDSSRHPIYQLFFSVQNFGNNAQANTLVRDVLPIMHSAALFDISLLIDNSRPTLKATLRYASSLFNEKRIKQLADIYTNVLEAFSGAVTTKIADIPTLNAHQQAQSLAENFTAAGRERPVGDLISSLYRQCQLTSEAVALKYDEQQLSYRQLWYRVNQLSTQILQTTQSTVAANQANSRVISLFFNKSIEMVVALLAIMRSGAAYCPISPEHPEERIRYILSDTASELIITEPHLEDTLRSTISASNLTCQILCEPQESSPVSAHENSLPLQAPSGDELIRPDSLAYVIYTSGTTGNPKGVMIEHGSVINLLRAQKSRFNFAQDEITLWLLSYIFDASVSPLFLTLCNGGQLHVAPEDTLLDTQAVKQLIADTRCTHITASASYLDALGHVPNKGALRRIVYGGECASQQTLREWQGLLINEYGPTETTVAVTANPQVACSGNTKNIGRALNGVELYILDKQKRLVPEGTPGELFIGGPCLARGYLNQAELTQRCFVANPFSEQYPTFLSTRLYRTGDIVRRLENKDLEYIGRNDDQLKIRGYRIEPAEIESAIEQHQVVSKAVVVTVKRSSGVLLAAYVELRRDQACLNELKQKIAASLPPYMQPHSFVRIETWPMTLSGKIDKRKLPEPDFNQTHLDAVATDTEKVIAKLWKEQLALDVVGKQTHFFKSGGDSIGSIKAVNAINLALNTDIRAQDLFSYPDIAALASYIDQQQRSSRYQAYEIHTPITEPCETAIPLTNVQQAYLFGRQGSFEMGNLATQGYLEFTYSKLDIRKLEATFNMLIRRHPALRTRFVDGEQYAVSCAPYVSVQDHGVVDKTAFMAIRDRLEGMTLDISQPPLIHLEVSYYNNLSWLHMVVDALILDAGSMNNLLTEWSQLYNMATPDIAVLPELEIAFVDYMMQYTAIRQSDLYQQAKAYWEEKITRYQLDTQLPMRQQPSSVESPSFKRLKTFIQPETWKLLSNKAMENKISPTSLLLYVYGMVLSRWSGDDACSINLTLFNRLPLHTQVDRLLGDFTVLELFHFERLANEPLSQALTRTHNSLWDDIEHNLFDGLDVQRLLRSTRQIPANKVICPYVLTSVLGNDLQGAMSMAGFNGYGKSQAQTSQVYIDNKAYEENGGLVAEWDYVDDIFDPEIITKMHQDYCQLIEGLAIADWNQALPDLILNNTSQLTAQQDEIAVLTENMTDLVTICFDSEGTKHSKVAVVDHYGEHSYGKLFQQTRRVASVVSGLPGKSPLIGVLCEKGLLQVCSTLGIMYAGNAYLPLNVEWPCQRLLEVLLQGGCEHVLLSAKSYQRLQNAGYLSDKFCWWIIEELCEHSAEMSQPAQINSEQTAYVIFTSGSTGKPKGVSITHNGACNTILAVNQRYQVDERDTVLALSELSFDLSVYDIFGLLAVGGKLVFPQQEKAKDPSHWDQLYMEHQVTVWNTVPQLVQMLADFWKIEQLSRPLPRVTLMSGDWIPLSLPTQLRQVTNGLNHHDSACQDQHIVSLGGATEGSIWSIWYDINTVSPDWKSIPYGYAMPGQTMHVLNSFGEVCPPGVLGEINIGGQGVAQGYWRDKEKTAAVFIKHPIFGRIYKTGDLGRQHSTGYIEFEGRRDHQVKINGYRVELDEIAARLTQLSLVTQAYVCLKQNTLVAYVQCKAHQLSEQELHTHIHASLSATLPQYMLPVAYIEITAMPLTANGKLDTSGLPEPDFSNLKPAHEAPETIVQIALANIWKEVTGTINPSLTDNFFQLGGNSIQATKVALLVNREFGTQFSLTHFFQQADMREAAHQIEIELAKHQAHPVDSDKMEITL